MWAWVLIDVVMKHVWVTWYIPSCLPGNDNYWYWSSLAISFRVTYYSDVTWASWHLIGGCWLGVGGWGCYLHKGPVMRKAFRCLDVNMSIGTGTNIWLPSVPVQQRTRGFYSLRRRSLIGIGIPIINLRDVARKHIPGGAQNIREGVQSGTHLFSLENRVFALLFLYVKFIV